MEVPIDIRGILSILPHRYPFVLIDRIIELVPHERVVGLKNVTMNEPFFQGHFPGFPVMPGVMILEAMAQAGGILANASNDQMKDGGLIFFTGLDDVRFRKPVVPGDQLTLTLTVIKMRPKVAKMAAQAHVEEQLVAQANLMATFGDVI